MSNNSFDFADDVLKVKILRDNAVLYQNIARLSDKKKLREIVKELKAKGVHFPEFTEKDNFDSLSDWLS